MLVGGLVVGVWSSRVELDWIGLGGEREGEGRGSTRLRKQGKKGVSFFFPDLDLEKTPKLLPSADTTTTPQAVRARISLVLFPKSV